MKIVSVLMKKPVQFGGKLEPLLVPGERGVERIDVGETGVSIVGAEFSRFYPFHLVEHVDFDARIPEVAPAEAPKKVARR